MADPRPAAATPHPRPPLLWIDVETLIQYAAYYRRPSGIQRVEFEVQRALRDIDPAGVRFCRHSLDGFGYAVVPWDSVATVFEGLAAGPPTPPSRPAAKLTTVPPLRAWARRQLYRLPAETRLAVGRLIAGLRQAAGAAAALPGTVVTAAGRHRDAARSAGDPAGSARFADEARPGDVLLSLGANWGDPHDAARIAAVRARFGLRHAVLVYDMIPLRRPEWCYKGTIVDFRRWFAAVVAQADHILAISNATAADIVWTAAKLGLPLRVEPHAIPLGTGFDAPPAMPGAMPGAMQGAVQGAVAEDALPAPGSYVLFVSTIEARKNHALLLRVWRRLLEERPSDAVPTLVFAGRVGWMVADLLQQLENAARFDGKVLVLEDLPDAAIARLYRDCLFTVYPSLYEGWGLPVTESFAHGKACLAANRTSLPEAGGDLARYFDPEDVADCHAAVSDWLDHPEQPLAAAARIRREFVPTPWRATAAALRRALGFDALAPAAGASSPQP